MGTLRRRVAECDIGRTGDREWYCFAHKRDAEDCEQENQRMTAHPIKFEIELDLNEWVAGQVAYDHDGEPYIQRGDVLEAFIANKVVERIAGDLKREIQKQVIDAVSAVATTLAEEQVRAVLSGPIPMTDSYGTPRGESKTLTELVTGEASRIFSKSVDSYRGKTVLDKIIADEVSSAFARELSEAMSEAKAKAVQAVRDKAADMLVSEMSKRP